MFNSNLYLQKMQVTNPKGGEKFTGLINENGKVESVENMGKKKLAYEIKKFSEATYMLFNFESNPNSIAELERVYRITDDIIKFIVVKK